MRDLFENTRDERWSKLDKPHPECGIRNKCRTTTHLPHLIVWYGSHKHKLSVVLIVLLKHLLNYRSYFVFPPVCGRMMVTVNSSTVLVDE